MRATSAFNRMLGLAGAWVRDVCFSGQEGVVVVVARRGRRAVCAGCGRHGRGVVIHEHKTKRWRHLDLAGGRCVLECEVRRLRCAHCARDGVEHVAWARVDSPYTRDFEDLCAWLAQQMSKKQTQRLLRIGWRSVGQIAARVVADLLPAGRLDGLVMVGVDEINWGADHQFLTCVADHATGTVVWANPGRNSASLQEFFDHLTPPQRASIKAVSIDMSASYEHAIRGAVERHEELDAEICFDPFHVIQLGGRAVDKVRRQEWNAHGRSGSPHGTWIKNTRYSLLKDPAKQTIGQLVKLGEIQQTNKRMWRSFLLHYELRMTFRIDPVDAPEHLAAWLAWASRSKLKPFVTLARTIRKHKAGILAAIRLGLSNGRLEGLNSKIRLISHRAYGFHSPQALIAMVYLCCGGIEIDLPHR